MLILRRCFVASVGHCWRHAHSLQLVHQWTNNAYTSSSLNKIMVIGMTRQASIRLIFDSWRAPVPSHSALKARLLVFGLIVRVIQGLGMQSPSSTNGPLQWRDLEIGRAVRPKGASPDDLAEWVVAME